MALNKFMHPRNIYKNPPDFAKLAKSFEEFSKIAKVDVTNKVTIDFKNPHSLRVLTRCLLKSDFNLDVIIPEDRLVPTLPLRLNYILWIEDLLNAIHRSDDVRGFDIGTGACAIYPLLAAVKNKWRMVGTETDEESLLKAQENVQRNSLQGLIELRKNPTASIMEHLFSHEDIQGFDFSMCNPPFYSNMQELCESRSPARHPPKNGFTGSPQELITEGGELAFCRKMIKESKDYKNKVIIFTTMVGHKYNLKELILDLKAEGLNHISMEFCQGRVTRWGLAWTYQDYDIQKLVPGREKSRKKNIPITYSLPQLPDSPYDIENVSKRIKSILQDLKIIYKVLHKRGNSLFLDVKASSNTWSNQRRKRRLMKRQDSKEPNKKQKLNESSDDTTTMHDNDGKDSVDSSAENKKHEESMVDKSKHSSLAETSVVADNFSGNGPEDKSFSDVNSCIEIVKIQTEGNCKNFNNNLHEVTPATSHSHLLVNTQNLNMGPPEAVNLNSEYANVGTAKSTYVEVGSFIKPDIVIHAFLKLFKKENYILLEMEYVDGSAGKEGIHQIAQYIKNNWK